MDPRRRRVRRSGPRLTSGLLARRGRRRVVRGGIRTGVRRAGARATRARARGATYSGAAPGRYTYDPAVDFARSESRADVAEALVLADFCFRGFGLDLVDARPGVVGGVDDALDLACRVDFLRFFFASGAEARSGVLGRGAPSDPASDPGGALSELSDSDSDTSSPREETDASARRAIGAAAAAMRNDARCLPRCRWWARRREGHRSGRVERPRARRSDRFHKPPCAAVLGRARRIRDSSGNARVRNRRRDETAARDRSIRCSSDRPRAPPSGWGLEGTTLTGIAARFRRRREPPMMDFQGLRTVKISRPRSRRNRGGRYYPLLSIWLGTKPDRGPPPRPAHTSSSTTTHNTSPRER